MLLRNGDSIENYFKNAVEFTNKYEDFIKKSVLFECYRQFCNDNSQKCKPRSTLFQRLMSMNFEIHSLYGYDGYRGIRIKDIKDEEDEIEDRAVNFSLEEQ